MIPMVMVRHVHGHGDGDVDGDVGAAPTGESIVVSVWLVLPACIVES